MTISVDGESFALLTGTGTQTCGAEAAPRRHTSPLDQPVGTHTLHAERQATVGHAAGSLDVHWMTTEDATDTFGIGFVEDSVEVAAGQSTRAHLLVAAAPGVDTSDLAVSFGVPTGLSTSATDDGLPPGTHPVSVGATASMVPGTYTLRVSATSTARSETHAGMLDVVVTPLDPDGPTFPVLTGTWDFVVDPDAAGACSDDPPEHATIEMQQAGSSLEVVGFGDGSAPWTGSVSQTSATFGGSRHEDDGTTQATFTLTINADGTLSGDEEWSYREPGGFACDGGHSSVTATRIG